MSNLYTHARDELQRAGLLASGDAMNDVTGATLLAAVGAMAAAGHSGASMNGAITTLMKLLCFENLTPITDNPAEWMLVSEPVNGVGEYVFQSTRNPVIFSNDVGAHYYSVNDSERTLYASAIHEPDDDVDAVDVDVEVV